MGPTQLRYCVCGATRNAPAALRIVSCVRCGRALRSEPAVPAAPSIAVAQIAALASQVLGAAGFCLVLAWAWAVKADARIAVGALLALGAVWVFAGGSALRGSVAALGCCAVLDVALALVVLANAAHARRLIRIATAHLVPAVATHAELVLVISAGVAAFAAVACIAAVPEVRRMAAWNERHLLSRV